MPKNRMLAALAGAALALAAQACHAYGEEGHSIVAEIAQRRLEPAAQAAVTRLLGGSMAAVASWPDDIKAQRPETYDWHFVDIPLAADAYDAARDCPQSGRGDCVVAELQRLRTQLACAPTEDERREALKYAIHFVGDIHQPLHAVKDKLGANQQAVSGVVHGAACGRQGCTFDTSRDGGTNLHSVWDTGLIRATVYDWGAYVERLEAGPLKDAHVQQLGRSVDPQAWANETHAVGQVVWPSASDAVFVVDDAYYARVLPLLDQELAVGGLRLASFLNAAYAGAPCGMAPQANLGDLKTELANYYTEVLESGHTRYELAQADVASQAAQYLAARVSSHQVARPALVLDIDETSLSNLQEMQADDFGYIPNGPCTLQAGYACGSDDWDKTMKATAIAPTLQLFRTAVADGVAVFFVTGRRESPDERMATAQNLERAGFVGYKALILRPQGAAGGTSTTDFKSRARARIEADGYDVVVNLGDQPSDLAGGHAERGFLMPNPAYRIP